MMEFVKVKSSQLGVESNLATLPPTLNRGDSTDMGDLSQIMPVIHPYTTAATGTGHGADYIIQDYIQAVINPAKAMALTVIDLLVEDAAKAREVLATSSPNMSKQQYLALQDSRLTEELYEGNRRS